MYSVFGKSCQNVKLVISEAVESCTALMLHQFSVTYCMELRTITPNQFSDKDSSHTELLENVVCSVSNRSTDQRKVWDVNLDTQIIVCM